VGRVRTPMRFDVFDASKANAVISTHVDHDGSPFAGDLADGKSVPVLLTGDRIDCHRKDRGFS
jgi:hypothetical protein